MCQHHKSGFDDMSDYYTWGFNRSYFSSTEEYIKNWRKRITTFDLYEIWYKEQNDNSLIKPTINQRIDYNFVPVNFLEYLGGNNYWLYRSNFNGIPQPSYWTKGNNAKGKFTIEELFNQFECTSRKRPYKFTVESFIKYILSSKKTANVTVYDKNKTFQSSVQLVIEKESFVA
jgi:hypothetical protein